MGGNMGGMGGNMGGMGGMGGNMGGMGGNMGGMGGNMGGMGGNMGGMGNNMGGMGGNMGGMGGNMGGMGGSGGGMGRSMLGAKSDTFVGKIKPTGRNSAWADGGASRNFRTRGFSAEKEKLPAKSSSMDDRDGNYSSASYAATGTDYKQESSYSNFSGSQAAGAASSSYSDYRAADDYNGDQQQTASAGNYEYSAGSDRNASTYSGSWSNTGGDYAGNRTGMANYSYT
ncbi:hypothetical protein HAZT_HAZT011595 [Hyalella azteca]|nr:hypothetical protein HAZT_HAZT011595 [Hyalella azteca]